MIDFSNFSLVREASDPKRLPQVFVSPRQCTDHWRRFEGGRQALVNIKSAQPAIPFDTPVTGMDQKGLRGEVGSGGHGMGLQSPRGSRGGPTGSQRVNREV